MKIKSQNQLFEGKEIEKPKKATLIYGPEALYVCPYCKNAASEDDCDVMGAEPDCLFCNQCNREFAT